MKALTHLVLSSLLIAALALSGAGCSKKAREAKAYQAGDKYFAAGDYDKAEVEYMKVLKYNRASARAAGQLGTMAFEDGQLARAYFFLNRAVTLDSNNLDLHVKLGQLYVVAGSPREARQQALLVLDQRPEDPDAPLLLADAAVTLNDDDAVRARLQKLAVAPAKRAPLETALAELYLREREMKLADAAFTRARAADAKFGPLYGMQANFYWLQKDLKKAEEAFKFSADTAPIRSPRRVKYAQFKIQNGDLAGGKRILQDIMDKAPDYLTAAMALANISMGEQKYDEANRMVTKVLARDPENYDALFLSARLGSVQNEPQRTVAEFEKLAKAYPRAPQVFYQLAMAYNSVNDSAKTLANLSHALSLNTNYVEAELAMAQLKLNKGDISSAIVTLRQIVERHAQLLQPQLLLADAYTQQGDFANADAIYKHLEATFPKEVQAPMMRGMIYLREGNREEASKAFERALAVAPTSLGALEELTTIEADDGHYDQALQRLQRVMATDTNAPEPSLLLAKLYLLQRQPEKAVATWQNTIVTHPDYGPAYVMLGNYFVGSGQLPKALEVARQLLAKHPEDPAGLMLLGTVLDGQKDVTAAEEAYEKVLKVSPKNSTALNNLAYLYGEHGHVEKALELARRARELQPFDASTADTLGWVLYRKGDFVQASAMLQESAKTLASSPDVQYHLGMTWYMLGEEGAARMALQYAVQTGQPFTGKDEAVLALSILAVDPKSVTPEVRAKLEKRVADQPGDPIALSRLATIYKLEGGLDKAIATYEAAIKANPKNVRALVDLAQIYSTRPNQSDKAFELAKAAYKITPDDPGVTRVLGPLAYRSGDYKWSLTLLQNAANKQAGDPELTYDLALSSYSVGQVAEAAADARKALQAGATFSRSADANRFLDMIGLAAAPQKAGASSVQVDQIVKSEPNYVPALVVSGIIAGQKGNTRAATDAFEKVLTIYPDFVPAERQLALLYAGGSPDDKRSAELAFKAYQAYPDDAEIGKALGQINYRLGDYSKAARYLKEAEAKKSGDAQLEYQLGMAQYKLKQKTDSKKSLTRALELKLADPQAADAKKVLAELK